MKSIKISENLSITKFNFLYGPCRQNFSNSKKCFIFLKDNIQNSIILPENKSHRYENTHTNRPLFKQEGVIHQLNKGKQYLCKGLNFTIVVNPSTQFIKHVSGSSFGTMLKFSMSSY